jgi:isopentenyldiphosphate isomerase
MEVWDVYDKDRMKTGNTMLRGSKFEPDTYHMVVHVCIFSSDGKMLIQQRQPFKEGWPNLWDITVGGSAVKGDTSQSAAEREVWEEIGYSLNLKNSRPSMTINFEHGFDDMYLLEEDLEINSLKVPSEEVQQVKWATKDEIIFMIDREEFIPYHASFINMLFDMRKNLGSHKKTLR